VRSAPYAGLLGLPAHSARLTAHAFNVRSRATKRERLRGEDTARRGIHGRGARIPRRDVGDFVEEQNPVTACSGDRSTQRVPRPRVRTHDSPDEPQALWFSDPAQVVESYVRRRDAGHQYRIESVWKAGPERDRVAGCERDDFTRIRCLVGVENQRPERCGWLGAPDYAGEEIECRGARQRGARWARAAGEGRRLEERDHRYMRCWRAMAPRASRRKREDELRYCFGGAAGLRCMEAGKGEVRRGSAIGRQYGRALGLASLDGYEWSVLQRVEEMAIAGELMVIIAGEALPGDEHVRLAAQAPAERGMRAAAGAGQ